jgi:3-oxoacyl-(acyl-carrier-protein) synthase
MALAAILEAVEGVDRFEDAALVLGTAHGAMHETVEFIEGVLRDGARFASPALFAGSLHNTMAGAASRELGLRGPSLVICNGESSFEAALSVALAMLRLGRVSRVVVGASDTYHPFYGRGLATLGMASTDPVAPDPGFARAGRGRHPGEGAGALLLEACPPGTRGVRVEEAVVGAEALRPRTGIGSVCLLAGGDAAGLERHRAAWRAVSRDSSARVSFPAARLGAFGSLGAVATALEADRLRRLPEGAGESVLLLQVPHGAPPAAVVLSGSGSLP